MFFYKLLYVTNLFKFVLEQSHCQLLNELHEKRKGFACQSAKQSLIETTFIKMCITIQFYTFNILYFAFCFIFFLVWGTDQFSLFILNGTKKTNSTKVTGTSERANWLVVIINSTKNSFQADPPKNQSTQCKVQRYEGRIKVKMNRIKLCFCVCGGCISLLCSIISVHSWCSIVACLFYFYLYSIVLACVK